uniref:(California timema) hypothetical protein n=1 Tax=Timema californicum TaxID=61474 RepID=A0A7R9IYB7_TIMCA|nr:unnamed protein product [Timema californicum]
MIKAKLETKALKAKRPGFTDDRYNETSYYIENERSYKETIAASSNKTSMWMEKVIREGLFPALLKSPGARRSDTSLQLVARLSTELRVLGPGLDYLQDKNGALGQTVGVSLFIGVLIRRLGVVPVLEWSHTIKSCAYKLIRFRKFR